MICTCRPSTGLRMQTHGLYRHITLDVHKWRHAFWPIFDPLRPRHTTSQKVRHHKYDVTKLPTPTTNLQFQKTHASNKFNCNTCWRRKQLYEEALERWNQHNINFVHCLNSIKTYIQLGLLSVYLLNIREWWESQLTKRIRENVQSISFVFS